MSEYSITSGATVVFYRPVSAAVTVLPQGTPISGIDGADGADGKTILNGIGAPSALLGVDGDLYLDTNYPPKLYGPKASGAWGTPVELVGPSGPAGAGGGHPFFLMGA